MGFWQILILISSLDKPVTDRLPTPSQATIRVNHHANDIPLFVVIFQLHRDGLQKIIDTVLRFNCKVSLSTFATDIFHDLLVVTTLDP